MSLQPSEPETTLFFGKTGAGKTSTINALFGTVWTTDHAQACTTVPTVEVLDRSRYPSLIFEYHRVVDLPGIGESLEADEWYTPYYEHWAAIADRIVWITQVDTRAYKRDELFLEHLCGMFKPSLQFIIGLNKVDGLGVDEGLEGFDMSLRQPSVAQLVHLPSKVEDIYNLFTETLNGRAILHKTNIIPYTAQFGWGLKALRQLFFMEDNNTYV